MPDHGRARTLLAALTLVALVMVSVDLRSELGAFTSVQRGAQALFAPLQSGLAAVVRPVGDMATAVVSLGSLRERNAQLEDDLRRLREEIPAVADLQRENAALRDLLGMRQRLQMDTVAAQVIGQPPGQVGFSVIIDAGARDGLLPGMAVVDDEGLVGKLTQVIAHHATVELVSSPSARYAVRTAPGGRSGLLQGQGSRPFLMEVRDLSPSVGVGELVVTSTFEGSSIPDGIPVGRVTDADARMSGRYRGVRPFVDFTALSVVQVVTNAEPAPSELPADELVPAPPRPRPRISPEPAVQPASGPTRADRALEAGT